MNWRSRPTLSLPGRWPNLLGMSDLSPRFRPVLDTVPVVQAGQGARGCPQAKKRTSCPPTSRPYGPLPSVSRGSSRRRSSNINRYSGQRRRGHSSARLPSRYAVPWLVRRGRLRLGGGYSSSSIESVSDPGSEVLYAWRSFEAYPPLADLSGATSVRVPLRDEAHDLDGHGRGNHPRAPGSSWCATPTTRPAPWSASRNSFDFLGRVPGDCLVVLDEATEEYNRDPRVPYVLAPLPRPPHVAVLRHLLQGLRGGRACVSAVHRP